MGKADAARIIKKLQRKGAQIISNEVHTDIFPDRDFESEGIKMQDSRSCEDADVVVCGRVADHAGHHPNSVEVPCASCGHMIWLSPISPMSPPKVCLQCVGNYDEEELFRRIGRKQ